MTHLGASISQKNQIENLLTTRKTHLEGIEHQTTIGEFKVRKKDNNMHFSPYGGSIKCLKRDQGTSGTHE